MEQFYKDLAFGQEGEKRVATLLESRGATNIYFNQDKLYDLRYTTKEGVEETMEVKTDRMFFKTGNVAIEIKSRGKPSGIASSQATGWVYLLGEKMYHITTPDLRTRLEELHKAGKLRKLWGGDNETSKLLLVPVALFTSWCLLLT